jgi:IS30 family transposase
MTAAEAARKAEVIKPLLKQGQSPYEILQAHPELDMSEKTLYNYIETGLFHEINGICALDLRRQTSRKISKKTAARYKKRHNRTFMKGRTYSAYLAFRQENPASHVVQIDTVYLICYIL